VEVVLLESLGFRVASLSVGTDWSNCVPVAPGGVPCLEIHASTTAVKVTALDELHAFITAALAQPVDGADETGWVVYGGRSTGADVTLTFTRDPGADRELDTIQILSIPAWKRSKAAKFLLGLTTYGFVTP
jgi:hypothetical protein